MEAFGEAAYVRSIEDFITLTFYFVLSRIRGRVHPGLQRSLVEWLERRLLLSLARRESC